MQKVAAYLLERREAVGTPEQRDAEVAKLLDILQTWLQEKGAKETSTDTGIFASRDLEARYKWERASTPNQSWSYLQLDEVTSEGRRFTTSVSVTNTGQIVAVYVSLEAGLNYSTVSPLSVNPKCPRFIRNMLSIDGKWHHGITEIKKCIRITGEQGGRELADEILNPDRCLPIFAISEDDGQILVPKLDVNLGHDLAGLANVVVIDHNASWGLTEVLGKSLSCYWGAVRIYWPRVDVNEPPYLHPIWTANRLLGDEDDLESVSNQFRYQMRRMLMQVSALSVLRPREIDEIRRMFGKTQLDALWDRAKSADELRDLLKDYDAENDRLREENMQLRSEFLRNQDIVKSAYEFSKLQPGEPKQIEPDKPATKIEPRPPKGSFRYYKTIGHNNHHDVMEVTTDCGHKNWETANKAEKGKKGVAHFTGHRDWKSIWHCNTCQGGGVWKVRW